MPSKDIRLETADNTYFHFKTDIFKREITYSTDKSMAANLVTIPAARAFEVIAMNKAGEKPLALLAEVKDKNAERKPLGDILGDNDLTRFDKKKKKRKPAKPQGQADRPARPKDGEERQPRRQQGPKPKQQPRQPKQPKPAKEPQQPQQRKPMAEPNDRYAPKRQSNDGNNAKQ